MLEGGLQREAGVEARGAGIAHDLSFRLAGGFREVLERWGQKVKLLMMDPVFSGCETLNLKRVRPGILYHRI